MNVAIGAQSTSITGFNGLYARGNPDNCPSDHLIDCFNCIFPGKSQIDIREPLTVQNTIPTRTIISYFIVNTSLGIGLLTLNANGEFWDETHATLLLTGLNLADDFTAINIFGRTYIAFKKQGKALEIGRASC